MSIAIVTAVTPDYLKKLKWCLPTWQIKPQFKDLPVYIFTNGFDNPENDLAFAADYFSVVKCIKWDMPEVKNKRELMLSSFVLGAARVVKEDYFIKLDADTFFTDDQDAFLPEDFNVDLCSHKWGYTKPGWWVDKLGCWVNNTEYKGNKKPNSKGDKRIISWCCLHKTEFVKMASDAAGVCLPVPSHDTYLWYLAEHFTDCSWKAVNLKKRGVNHCSREKTIRENICSNYTNFRTGHTDETLLNNIQIEVTYSCNRNCFNCDRNCGNQQAPTNDHMTIEQIQKFVNQCEDMEIKFNRIDIIGGEPLLHKNIVEIVELCKPYANRIRLTTNGDFPYDHIPEYVKIRDSSKEEKGQGVFDAVNVAPIDKGVESPLACSIPWRCGIALTPYGYFPCGAGASVARVFGFDIGIKHIKDVTPESLQAQMRQLCRFCGHSLSTKENAPDNQVTSESWEKAYSEYKNIKPMLIEF